jgi:mannose-6-phosphate isomerase-like protein (cupin superfamily)
MMMPKERFCRLPMSQPRVKWSFGASSCSRCNTTEVGISALASGGGVGFSSGLLALKILPAVLTYLKVRAASGAEVHKLDQFFRVEDGTGEAVLDGIRTVIRAGCAVVVPAGAKHNMINTGSVPLKLYTLYAPPNHRDGVVHHTRDDAEAEQRTLRRQNDGIESGNVSTSTTSARET